MHVQVHEDPFWVSRPKGFVFSDVPNEETVSEFRLRISHQPGKPTPDSIKLVVSGKPIGLARGGERLKDVLAELDKVPTPSLHCGFRSTSDLCYMIFRAALATFCAW